MKLMYVDAIPSLYAIYNACVKRFLMCEEISPCSGFVLSSLVYFIICFSVSFLGC